jgi:two-component system NtrC family sensor kinase
MVPRPAETSDSRTADLLRRIADVVVAGGEGDISEVLAALGRDLGFSSALWTCAYGMAEPIAAYPADGLDLDGLYDQVVEWSESLEAPLVRQPDRDDDPALSHTPRLQLIWPLDVDGSGRAIWVLETNDELPDVAATAELLRVALSLRRARERQAEHEALTQDLKTAQELMGHIVDSLPVGLYVVDKDYNIVAWNRKRESGTQGVAREDAIGKSVFEVLYRQPKEKLVSELEEVFKTDEIRAFDVESTASGESRHYRLTKVPMHVTGTNEVTHVITVGEDVTEQKRIHERIAHAEKLAALGQMAAGVMHEINNPLATITAGVDAIMESVEALSEEAELLSMIENEVDRCKRIARDLLAFSRPPPSEKGPADLQETVEETLRLLQHHDRFKKIEVHREYVYDLPLVWANSERLVQVFVALALNALDAMEGEGELRVRAEFLKDEDAVGISFIDTGCGIPPSDLPKIFEPFYTSKLPGKGTGLGLSICYGIIREHGGRVEVDSRIGAGSNFRIVLPAYQIDEAEDDTSAETESE